MKEMVNSAEIHYDKDGLSSYQFKDIRSATRWRGF